MLVDTVSIFNPSLQSTAVAETLPVTLTKGLVCGTGHAIPRETFMFKEKLNMNKVPGLHISLHT